MRKKGIVSTEDVLLILLFAYFLYSFWFQYAIKPISGVLPILGVLILVFSLLRINTTTQYYKQVIPIGFFLVALIISNLLSGNLSYSFGFFIQIIKYIIPMYGMFVYVGNDHTRFIRIVRAIAIASLFLTITSFFKQVYYVSYANDSVYHEGELNPNVFSSYMMMGIICSTYLYLNSKKRLKLIWVGFIALECLAQLYAASRRGILVCLFLVVAFIHTMITVKDEKNFGTKLVTLLLVIVGVGVIASEFSLLSSEFLGIQRILGYRIGGDASRQYYHLIALQLFKQHIFIGNGLGAVAMVAGMYSHSFYYELLACTGILGTLIMLIYILFSAITFFKYSLKRSGLDGQIRINSRMFFWYVISLLICGIAVTLVYDSYFYILIGLFACALKVFENSRRIEVSKFD